MNAKELIDATSDHLQMSKKDVVRVINEIERKTIDALSSGDEIILPGIGKLVRVDKPARTARNPKTGEAIDVPAKRTIKLKPAKSLLDAINSEE